MPKKLSDLAVGTLIKDMGTTYYGEPIVWKIADKNHSGYPANSVTLISDRILTVKAFDAKEPNSSNADRQQTGSNRYTCSNLRQWLNSSAGAGEWYTAQNPEDTPPTVENVKDGHNPYDTQAGFLNSFSTNLINALLPTNLIVAKNTVADGGGSETITDKIFLASTTEISLQDENSIAEGARLAIFGNDTTRLAKPTTQAVSNNTYVSATLNADSPWYWWLRTPSANYASRAREVNSWGSRNDAPASYGYRGVRPLCNIPSSVLVSQTADTDSAYILWNQPPTISGDDGTLGIKLDAFLYEYTVTDDRVTTVQERVNGELIRSYTVQLGEAETMSVSGTNWLKLSRGEHTLTVTATDALGDASTRTMTFTKQVDCISVMLAQPLSSVTQPKRINIDVVAQVPAGANIKVETCNNANDPAPAWEDATKAAMAKHAHVFSNPIKQATDWGVNIRVTISRNNAIGDCYITGIKGNFE